MKQNRFQRIAAVALARAQPAGWAVFVLGVAAFLLLPLAGKKCYLDEKALLVGGAAPTIRRARGPRLQMLAAADGTMHCPVPVATFSSLHTSTSTV